MPKYRRVREMLVSQDVVLPRQFLSPRPASADVLAAAHAAKYVEAVITTGLAPEQIRRIGLPMDEPVVRRSLAAVGGTVDASWHALRFGVACNLAGGSHHAHRDCGSGYCVFNDVAVAATALLHAKAVERILVIDLDVHQGDGTAAMFAGDDRVYTFSMHAARNFPARKQLSDRDVALDDQTCDAVYLDILTAELQVLMPLVQPDIVFYNAGVDPHRDDRLGRLALTDDGLARRDRLVIDATLKARVPLVCVLGGGYDVDPCVVAGRHVLLHKQLRDALVSGAA